MNWSELVVHLSPVFQSIQLDNFQHFGSLLLPHVLGDGGLHHGSLQLVEDVVMVLPLLGGLYQLVELVLKALPADLDRFDGKLKIIENEVLV